MLLSKARPTRWRWVCQTIHKTSRGVLAFAFALRCSDCGWRRELPIVASVSRYSQELATRLFFSTHCWHFIIHSLELVKFPHRPITVGTELTNPILLTLPSPLRLVMWRLRMILKHLKLSIRGRRLPILANSYKHPSKYHYMVVQDIVVGVYLISRLISHTQNQTTLEGKNAFSIISMFLFSLSKELKSRINEHTIESTKLP